MNFEEVKPKAYPLGLVLGSIFPSSLSNYSAELVAHQACESHGSPTWIPLKIPTQIMKIITKALSRSLLLV